MKIISLLFLALSLYACGASETPHNTDDPVDESVNQMPAAAATQTCARLSCNFDASFSSDADGTVVSYVWDFGDNKTATGVAPNHIYTNAGEYTVVLEVTDNDGGVDSVSMLVVVSEVANQQPTASFTTVCIGLICDFDAAASSDSDGSIASFSWSFGDANSSSVMALIYSYASSGSYTVKLQVTDNSGAIGTITKTIVLNATNQTPTASFTQTCTLFNCNFDASSSSDADGTVVSYVWDFGDNKTATGVAPNHIYTNAGEYTVVLEVTDNDGGVDSVSMLVVVSEVANQQPTASFTTVCIGLICDFDAAASSDSDGSIASFSWSFGGANSSSVMALIYSYASAGSYTVELQVTDNSGAIDTITKTIVLNATNQTPTASFTQTCTLLNCDFDASSSSDTDGTVVNYVWDFGDNKTATGVAPNHIYTNAGEYTVVLEVTDNDGGVDSVSMLVVVTEATNQLPIASFTSECVALNCDFDASASSDSDGSIASYSWSFGDANSGSEITPMHTYASAGSYTVELQVTDNSGAIDTITKTIVLNEVNQTPTASFTQTCTGQNCIFDASSSTDPDGTIDSYNWNFGDNNISTGVSPSYAYASAGNYIVALEVTDNNGATHETSTSITVKSNDACQGEIYNGTTYYVSLTGSDGNAGTLDEPFRTIAKGASIALVDDTVIVSDGDYGSEEIIINKSGTSDCHRLLVKAAHPGQVILKSDGTGTGIFISNANYVTLDGFSISNYTSGIKVSFGGNHLLKNNILTNNHGVGIQVWKSNDNIFERNQFLDPLLPGQTTAPVSAVQDYGINFYHSDNNSVLNSYFFGFHNQALSFKKDSHGGLVSGNTFEGCLYTCVYLGQNDEQTNEASLWCSNITVENNVFRTAASPYIFNTGITLRNIKGAVVRNNFMEGNNAGVGIFVKDRLNGPFDVDIYNNVIVDGSKYSFRLDKIDSTIEIANNTVVNIFESPNGVPLPNKNNYVDSSYNYTVNTDGFLGPFTGTVWPSVPNPQFSPDFTRAQPFNLKSTSSLKDTGQSIPVVTTDFNGTERPQGSAHDIGAFEYIE